MFISKNYSNPNFFFNDMRYIYIYTHGTNIAVLICAI